MFVLLSNSGVAYACGCGLALSDEKTFNSLKETQAYLLIDVKDKNHYVERPFFRMVSMDKPYDVTLVFPLKDIPNNVTGERITAAKLFENYGINDAETAFSNQKIESVIAKTSYPLFIRINGFFVTLADFISRNMLGGAILNTIKVDSLAPVASFEFEGGRMDVYDVKDGQKLEDFVKTINVPLSDTVLKTVEKYKEYYTAVLTLNVKSVIPQDEIEEIKACIPAGFPELQTHLTQKNEFSQLEINNMVNNLYTQSSCSEDIKTLLYKYIQTSLNANSSAEGILVNMEYTNNSNFFYPTSIVNTYKYPIVDQRYYIKVPLNLAVENDTTFKAGKAVVGNNRWYKTTNTETDLRGVLVNAGYSAKISDKLLGLISEVNQNHTGKVITAMWLLVYLIPLFIFKKFYKLTAKDMLLNFILYAIFGILILSLKLFIKKQRKYALVNLVVWFISLGLMILFAVKANDMKPKTLQAPYEPGHHMIEF